MIARIYQLLDYIMNIVILSLIVILGFLPVITFFPTIVALLGVKFFYVKKKAWGSHVEAFIHYFKNNFKFAFMSQLIWMSVMLIGTYNLIIVQNMNSIYKVMISSFTVFFMTFMSLVIGNMLSSLLINPNDTLIEHLKKSILLVVIKLPQSFLLVFIFFIGGNLILIIPQLVIIVVGLLFFVYYILQKKIWYEFFIKRI